MLGQLQLRRLLQGRRHPLRLDAGDRGARHRRRAAVGHGPRERRRGRGDLGRPRRGAPRPHPAHGRGQLLEDGRHRARAGRARSCTSTGATSSAPAAARPTAARSATSRSGTWCSCSTTACPTAAWSTCPAQHRHRGRASSGSCPCVQGVRLDVRDRPHGADPAGGRGGHRHPLRRPTTPRDVSLRILTDHARAMAMLVADGVLPVERGARLRAAPRHPPGGAPGPSAGRGRADHAAPGRRRGRRARPGLSRHWSTTSTSCRPPSSARRATSGGPSRPARPSSTRSWPRDRPGARRRRLPPARHPRLPHRAHRGDGGRGGRRGRPGRASTRPWPAQRERAQADARRPAGGRRRRGRLPGAARHVGADRCSPATSTYDGPATGGGGAGRRRAGHGRDRPRPHPLLRRVRRPGGRHRGHHHRDGHGHGRSTPRACCPG